MTVHVQWSRGCEHRQKDTCILLPSTPPQGRASSIGNAGTVNTRGSPWPSCRLHGCQDQPGKRVTSSSQRGTHTYVYGSGPGKQHQKASVRPSAWMRLLQTADADAARHTRTSVPRSGPDPLPAKRPEKNSVCTCGRCKLLEAYAPQGVISHPVAG